MPKLWLVGCFPAKMRSVGDHAQTLALTEYFKKFYGDYELNILTRDNRMLLDTLAGNVEAEDVVFISSSGDFGSFHSYNGWHERRKKIVASVGCRVVQLPVTVFYEDTPAGYGLFERDKTFFYNLPDFLLLTRTPSEAKLLRENFSCRVNWFPDFAYNLPRLKSEKREGVLVVLRDDLESAQNNVVRKHPSYMEQFFTRRYHNIADLFRKKQVSSREQFLCSLEKRYSRVVCKDIQVSKVDITDANRKQVVYDVLKAYGEYELVVTDRFHSAIFAALTDTPCVVLPSKIPHKITAGLELLPNVIKNDNVKHKFIPVNYTGFFNNFRSSMEKQFSYIEEVKSITPIYSMIALNIIKNRRSVRVWDSQKVGDDKVKLLLEAGYYAPSAANMQAVKIVAEQDPEKLEFLRRNTSPWFGTPSLALLFFYDKKHNRTMKLDFQGWHSRFVWQDTSCAAMNVLLVAESLGLKGCWCSLQPRQEQTVKRKYGVADSTTLACMVFLGYSRQNVSLKSLHQGKPVKRDVL